MRKFTIVIEYTNAGQARTRTFRQEAVDLGVAIDKTRNEAQALGLPMNTRVVWASEDGYQEGGVR